MSEEVPYNTHFHFSTSQGHFVAMVNESNALLGCCALSGVQLCSATKVYSIMIYCTTYDGRSPLTVHVSADAYHAYPQELVAQEILDKWDALMFKVEALNVEAAVFARQVRLIQV